MGGSLYYLTQSPALSLRALSATATPLAAQSGDVGKLGVKVIVADGPSVRPTDRPTVRPFAVGITTLPLPLIIVVVAVIRREFAAAESCPISEQCMARENRTCRAGGGRNLFAKGKGKNTSKCSWASFTEII